MASVLRKNGWQLAQVVGDRTPDATQRLLYQVRWSTDTAVDRLLQYKTQIFGKTGSV